MALSFSLAAPQPPFCSGMPFFYQYRTSCVCVRADRLLCGAKHFRLFLNSSPSSASWRARSPVHPFLYGRPPVGKRQLRRLVGLRADNLVTTYPSAWRGKHLLITFCRTSTSPFAMRNYFYFSVQRRFRRFPRFSGRRTLHFLGIADFLFRPPLPPTAKTTTEPPAFRFPQTQASAPSVGATLRFTTSQPRVLLWMGW